MSDWIVFGVSIAALVWALRRHHNINFPPDPPSWKAPGLRMSVRKGRIHYRSIKR